MYKIPKFWRKFQIIARPSMHWADRRLKALVRRGQLTEAEARNIRAQLLKQAA